MILFGFALCKVIAVTNLGREGMHKRDLGKKIVILDSPNESQYTQKLNGLQLLDLDRHGWVIIKELELGFFF